MKRLEEYTKDELISALLQAPIPLMHFDQDKEEYQDPDYKEWYEEFVVPLRDAREGRVE